jgi:two-component system, OmpR family, response regulator
LAFIVFLRCFAFFVVHPCPSPRSQRTPRFLSVFFRRARRKTRELIAAPLLFCASSFKHPAELSCPMNPKKVLIVDDESGFTRLLKLTLERSGKYMVREENDGTKAWLLAREFLPDIIFLDVVMPKIDGGDVAQQIRSDPLLAKVPIFFLTAIVNANEDGQEIGGYPFLAKPVSIDTIIKCIEANTASEEAAE